MLWYKPIDWETYSAEKGPIFPFVIFHGIYAYFQLELEVGGVFHFQLLDFAQSDEPIVHFSTKSLRGLRESSKEEAAESAAWIAKKMIEKSLGRNIYDSFDR